MTAGSGRGPAAMGRNVKHVLPAILLLWFWAAGPVAADDAVPETAGLGAMQRQAALNTLSGWWVAGSGAGRIKLELHKDGSFVLGPRAGDFSLDGERLILRADGMETAYTYQYRTDQLTVSGGDLAVPLVFNRGAEIQSYVAWIRNVRLREWWQRLYRLITVALIVVLSRLILLLMRWFSRWLVLSDAGPLRFVYRRRKNRALTLHSVVLNICKYVIYFSALGVVLSELGVNYTAYLASLSVIGLAVGFGSQGLVQDVVTGFFLVFEGQFEVGDMVEISGQTGVVEDLGLRMTRLRNYMGQVVCIPNRNIAVVGNYTQGGQQVQIELSLVSAEKTAAAQEILPELLADFAGRYTGVFRSPPRLSVTGAQGAPRELQLKIACVIWPGQQVWLIEQQLVARIRESLKAAAIDIAGDRVVCHYQG